MSHQTSIVFLHIPKCAGTSVADAIREHVGAENSYFYGKNEPYKQYEKSAPDLGRYRFIKGHLTLQQINLIRGPKKIFTLMREPVGRVLSWYEFMARHKLTTLHPFAARGGPHAFIQKCLDAASDPNATTPIKTNAMELRDGMTQRFTPTRKAEQAIEAIRESNIKVINQGNLDAEIDELWDWLELPKLTVPKLNTAPKKKPYPTSVVERVRELNQEDEKLFNRLFSES